MALSLRFSSYWRLASGLIVLLFTSALVYAADKPQSRPVGDFTVINLNLSGEVFYRPGAPHLTITAPANIKNAISSEVRNGELLLQLKGQEGFTGKIRIELSSPALKAAVLSGSGNLTLHRLNTDKLALVSTGSGHIKVSGSAAQLNVQVSGPGNVDAASLAVERLQIDVFGSGDVNARASNFAHVHVMSDGNVTVAGNPLERVQEAHGSGKITFQP